MTADRPSCAEQGYSPCGTPEFRDSIGTSFAAPQVAAAAALVLAVRPDLKGDQVTALLERTADDASPASGCRQCPLLRDEYSGWGTLNILKALQVATSGEAIPVADQYETNDEAGPWARKLYGAKGKTVRATLDYWDDQLDVYSIYLPKGKRLFANLSVRPHVDVALSLWRPGTKNVDGIHAQVGRREAVAKTFGTQRRLGFTANRTGDYYLAVKLHTQTAAQYTLSYVKR
jgi:hypothetical protein